MPDKPKPPLDFLDELLDSWCSESAFYTIAKSGLAALREKAGKWDSYVEWCEEYAEERPDLANVYRDGTYAELRSRPTWGEVIDEVYDHECVKSYGLCDCRGEIIRELRELQKRKEVDNA